MFRHLRTGSGIRVAPERCIRSGFKGHIGSRVCLIVWSSYARLGYGLACLIPRGSIVVPCLGLPY